MKKLSEEDRKRVADAVAAAESQTGGEIATAIIPESDDYAFRELLFGVVAGILAFLVLLSVSVPLGRFLERSFWIYGPWMLTLVTGMAAMIIGAAAYFLAQIPAVDRLVVPRRDRIDAVRHRAMRHFVESGIAETVDRTGILLFVSLLERRVELVADKGINEKVATDTWDRIVSALVRGIKENRTAEALAEAVEACGTVLAEHVPRRKDDKNELDDGTAELGRGS